MHLLVAFVNIQIAIKGKQQHENKLISYERASKMLENDTYIAEIGQAVLGLLSFKVGPGNHQRGLLLLKEFSDIFRNMRLDENDVTSDKSQFLNIKN